MRRFFGALVLGLAAAAVAQAHALYILADGGDPAKAIVVFSDELAPDANVKEASWKKVSGIKLVARDTSGKETAIKATQEKDHMKAPAPAGTKVIYGTVDYGAFAKGDAKPKALMFHPKAILGDVPADGAALGEKCGLDVVPKIEAGKVRFQVLASGKPVANAKVGVMLPEKKGDSDHADAVTDEKGWTQAFDAKGRYGVTVRHEEAKPGESNGVKYEVVLHSATLVVDVK